VWLVVDEERFQSRYLRFVFCRDSAIALRLIRFANSGLRAMEVLATTLRRLCCLTHSISLILLEPMYFSYL